MRHPLNVLVMPGGTEIGMEINHALRACKAVRLFSAGQNTSNHSSFIFLHHAIMPSVYQEGWIERLNEIIDLYNIDYIFPAHDDVLVALARHARKILAKIVTSPLRTCLITRSKRATHELFRLVLPVPAIYHNWSHIEQFPVFVKPDKGEGSRDAERVNDKERLDYLMNSKQGLVAFEYLSGDEYTVDCFSDRDQGLLYCGARKRVRTRSGISMNSIPVVNVSFDEYAHCIARHLKFYGAWFFQVKRDDSGVLRLMEVAPRIAGTMSLNRVLGVNFSLLALYEQERIPITIVTNACQVETDRALVNRYRHMLHYNHVYVDLDDTLIIQDKVNTDLVCFLYQCLNEKKKLILLTRHQGDLSVTLHRFRLTGLFDQIFTVGLEGKASHIKTQNAIFIDDSFSERMQVQSACNIPTFDCSMIEMLLDDRR